MEIIRCWRVPITSIDMKNLTSLFDRLYNKGTWNIWLWMIYTKRFLLIPMVNPRWFIYTLILTKEWPGLIESSVVQTLVLMSGTKLMANINIYKVLTYLLCGVRSDSTTKKKLTLDRYLSSMSTILPWFIYSLFVSIGG